MPKKQSKKTPFTVGDLETYVQKEVERTGKSKEVIIEETFHDGWLSVSETDEGFKVDTSQLFKSDPAKDPLSECRRLRKEFGPISAAVDYVKDIILGGGIDIFIKNPKDTTQKKLKEELLEWMRLVYQDNYLRKFNEILNILVDEALTIGFAAAEIVYSTKPKNNSFFDDYTKPITQSIMTKQGEKIIKQDVITYEITEPDWKDLQGIARLKILRDAINRLKLYRTPSWEANYLTLDEPNQTPQNMPVESQIVAQSLNKTVQVNQGKPSAIFLPWQIFSLALNRREWNEKGESIILSALSTVQLLEKIMKAVGEGIHRAGNKKYFIVCVEEGTPVWTPNGYKPIEQIQVGDMVWSKHSTAEVLQTFKNLYKGNLHVIKPKMLESVSFTPNHPIKVAQKIRMRTKEGHEQYLTKFVILDGYKRADQLTIDDWVIVPKIKESKDIWIDFPKTELKNGRFNVIPSQYLSEDLAKLFGWYLAEGCVNNKTNSYSVIFSLGHNETHFAQEILDLAMTTLGIKGVIYKKPTGLQIYLDSKSFAEFIVNWFGHGAGNKHLPEGFIYWRPEILNAMLSRIVMGDGNTTSKDHWAQLKLNSHELQKQLQLVLMKLGHRASLMKVHRNPIGYIQGRQINQHDAWRLTWNEINKSIAEDEDNYYFRIAKITTKLYEGYTYNLHTSMNEMLLPFITRQCGTEKRPWSPVHIRNLLSQLKEASEKSWSTIPVPSGFDIKEAGGEVFEAQNAVDYFLRIIAGSLHIPPSVLGVDFKEIVKSDIPHYTHRRMQDALRTAIETQVFRLHIWAKFGAKRGKQGGHEDPQYIPEARIKSEALLSEQAKLTMHIQILNVANPVRPEVKLEVERDIAALMGWDILLPTQEEYKTEMDKADADLKAQLAAKAEKSEETSTELEGDEKFQGPPKPPSEEQLAKRQEGGVNVRKVGTKKGQSKEMGSTRMIQESEEEEIEETEQKPQKLEIIVKTESKPQEVIVKAESHGMIDEIMTELAKERIELAKKQKELTEKEQELTIEESKKHQEKIQSEIENIKTSIEETRRTIEQKTAEMEKTKAETERIKMESNEIKKTHEAETEKIKIESEEIKKTHAKKRKIMEKLEEKLERDKIIEGEK